MPSPFGSCLVPYPAMPIAASKVLQTLRATGIGAFAIEHVDTVLRGILADRVGEFIDHAFDRQKVQPGADRPQLPRRVALRHLVEELARTL